MTDALKQARDALPPLPEPAGVGMLIDYRWEGAPSLDPRAAHPHVSVSVPAYTADQMREYARAAIARADAAPRDDGMPASADERHLRRLLAIRVGMPHTYTDDGEANGQQHDIAIDFMREPVADIDAKLRALNVARAECADAAQATPVAGWISVDDSLPPKFTEVLVAFAGQNTLASTGQWTDNHKHDVRGWCYPAENRGCTDGGDDPVVTHWMPLPDVPLTPRCHKPAAPPAPAAQPLTECNDNDSPWLVCKPCAAAGKCARAAVTDAMVDAYLKANDAYWKRTDELPAPPDKWRTGTAQEATRVSLAAALQAAQQEPAQAVPFTGAQTAATTLVRVLVEPAQADARDAARLDWMAQHEARIGWNREGDACRVWVRSDDPSDPDPVPVCGWAKTFDNPRAAIDAAIDAAQAMPAGGA